MYNVIYLRQGLPGKAIIFNWTAASCRYQSRWYTFWFTILATLLRIIIMHTKNMKRVLLIVDQRCFSVFSIHYQLMYKSIGLCGAGVGTRIFLRGFFFIMNHSTFLFVNEMMIIILLFVIWVQLHEVLSYWSIIRVVILLSVNTQ